MGPEVHPEAWFWEMISTWPKRLFNWALQKRGADYFPNAYRDRSSSSDFHVRQGAQLMRVLVTGATGFAGSVVGRVLGDESLTLRAALRRADDGMRLVPAFAEAALAGELSATTDWHAAVKDIDALVHLAGRAHVLQEDAADPLAECRRINRDATLNLARQAAAAGVKRLVFVSTVKVNGEGREASYTALDTPDPRDAYAISKWEAEQGLHEIAAQTGLEVVILRPPLIYGPGVKANFLRLLQAVDRGIPLPLGAVRNRRSLLYVENFASALLACLTHPEAAGKTYFVRDGEDVSSAELVRRLAHALGRPARLVPVPAMLLRAAGALLGKKAAVERLLGSLTVDDTPLRRELGWAPPFSLDEGLAATARWYLQHRDSRRTGAPGAPVGGRTPR